MSNETLGIRVDLSGGKAAADGLQGVATAENNLAEATKKVNAASKDAKTSGDALNTTINQTATASTRGGEALREMEARSRSLANSQQGVAASMAGGVAQTGLMARAGGVLATVMGVVATAATVLAATMAVAAPAIYFSQATEAAQVTLARINGITGSLSESRKVYAGLVDDAIRLRVTVAGTLSGYTRIAGAVAELGGTSNQARQINEIVLATAKASGIAADEAAAAARQFAQALGSGVLQGDELRSIMENNQELARQLARGLNVSVSELRKMGAEGTLTADIVANALLSRLPEIRAKLADVPLTSADAWTKLSAVLSRWVLQGDQVEMKAGLIARAMNAIADGIERSRSAAATPITVTVREVYQSEGGAAFIGPNRGRRDPAAIAAEQQAAINAANTARGSAIAAIRAADNEITKAAGLGLEIVGKKALEGLEKYADSMMLGSEKIQKAYEKESKALAISKAKLTSALASGDPATVATAQSQLAKIAELEIKASADTARKIADARRSEASRGNGEAKAAQANAFREAIAQQEAYQTTIEQALTAESSALKRQYEQRKISAQEYYGGLAAIRLVALAQQEESVRRELELSRAAVARGDASKKADVAKYLAELERFAAKRISVAEETEDAITAIETRARDERLRAQAEANTRFNEYLNQSGDLVRAMQAENEQRQFELSLIGLTEQAAAQMQARRQAELTIRRALTQAYREYIAALNASDSNDRDKSITDAYNKQVAGIRAVGAEQADLTIKVQQTGTAYSQMSSFVDGFINAAFSGFKSLKDFLKNQLFDWLKQSLLKPFIMQIAASVSGGLAGTVANAAGGGGSSIVGSLASTFLGSGSFLGGILGTAGLGAAGTAFTATLAATSSVTGALGAAATSLAASGGILGAAASVLGSIPIVGWIALAAGLAYSLFGKRENGFKIDNNLTNVGNPASHFTANAISRYDISGRGTDDPQIQAALAPLKTAVNTIDELLANKLLGADVLASIRRNMNLVNNASSWENLDSKGIEKGTLAFLMQRYGVIFDEVDAKIAASVRGFTGTSEALLQFIGSVVGVMQTLKDNAAYFKAVIGESISVGQVAGLAKEGESLAQTLTRVVNVFTATNGVAALMGRDVTTAFGAVGLASLEARQNLIDLAGGIQALDQMSQFFYENFYTEAERGQRDLAAANASVAATFAEMKLAVPATRAEFRALVEAQDLTTEAGRRTWTALMRVAGAFTVMVANADAAVNAVNRYGQRLDDTTPDRYGGTRGSAPGAVTAPPAVAASNDFLNQFFTQAERDARRLAQSAATVAQSFSLVDVAVPRTRAEFVALAAAQDLTTARGRQVYAMLMDVAGAFADVTASSIAVARSTEYLENFFTATERRALHLAESANTVNAGFSALNLTVPTTRAQFRELVEAQDLTTEAGRRTWNALMALVPAFRDLTSVVEELQAVIGVGVGEALDAGVQSATASLAALFAIIDSTGESTAVKLQRKLAASGSLASQLSAQYTDRVRLNGGGVDAGAQAIAAARDEVLRQQATLAGNLALLTTLQAQYGGFAEQMYELTLWRDAQVTSAQGNVATLLIIEQSYQARREAILNGGVASGLSSLSASLRTWMDGLLLNQELSILTPAQRLAEARSQVESAALSGNASQMTGAGDAYLRELRSMFASGQQYTDGFNWIRSLYTQIASNPTASTSGSVPAPPVTGSVGGGSSAATTASTAATAAATTAVAAANATVDAVNATKAVLAEIMAQTKNAVVSEAQTTRAAEAANTDRVVAAVSNRASSRVI